MSTTFGLKDKVALVTGGAQGIGLSITKAFLQNGVKGVAIVDVNEAKGKTVERELHEEFFPGCAVFIKADVSSRVQFKEALEQTVKVFKQLDIVVNNAGIIQELDWEKCIGVNLQGCVNGSLLALQNFFPKYLGGSEGIILNVASVAGLLPLQIMPVYSATKHGIIAFTRSLANPDSNIKVFVICPHATDTPLKHITTDQVNEQTAQIANQMAALTPLQTPEDLAKHALQIIQEAETGTVWVLKDNTRERITFPDLIQF